MSKSGITQKQWVDLADQAYFRLKEIIDLAAPDDKRLLGAIQESFNRAYGKPTEVHEISGKDGGPIIVLPQELTTKHGITSPTSVPKPGSKRQP